MKITVRVDPPQVASSALKAAAGEANIINRGCPACENEVHNSPPATQQHLRIRPGWR